MEDASLTPEEVESLLGLAEQADVVPPGTVLAWGWATAHGVQARVEIRTSDEGVEGKLTVALFVHPPMPGVDPQRYRCEVNVDNRGFSEETCLRCGWRMGSAPLNCQNDNTPHVFPSQLQGGTV